MDESNKIAVNPSKARMVELGFKKRTEGLSEAEEAELQRLRREAALS